MKKILSILLLFALVLSVAACGNKPVDETVNQETVIGQEDDKKEDSKKEESKKEETKKDEDNKEDNKEDSKKEDDKKEETKPEEKPETTPEEKPETPPAPETSGTVGLTLLSQFKSIASSGSALSVAEKLVANPIIAFAGGAMEVEPGYLTGFDNTEIKGFKEGAMFAPMIGTIPFVGYVFTLEAGVNASDFISTLKSSANLRWNICTSADEIVTGTSGDKVFFVMSPLSFEEE